MATPTPPPGDIRSLSSYANTPPNRLQSLYSDISRQKHSNPAFYGASVEWWRRVLEEVVSSGMQGRLCPSDGSKLVLMANRSLLDMFRVEGVGKPLGLAAVVVSILGSPLRSDFLSNYSLH
jgi:charged multivesicular body protein 7